jgi:hypothetical protein
VTTTSRIEDLRRRVDNDPASIAFAQLAEEHRRNSDYEEAVRVARAGLVHLPGYLSARVTLGRALWQLGQVEDARRELEWVLATAPENLAAVGALAEIHEYGRTTAPVFPAAIEVLAGDLATTFAEGAVDAAPTAPAAVDDVKAFLDQLDQFALDDARPGTAARASAAQDVPTAETRSPQAVSGFATALAFADSSFAAPAFADPPACATATAGKPTVRPGSKAVAVLEDWLSAIVADRAARG